MTLPRTRQVDYSQTDSLAGVQADLLVLVVDEDLIRDNALVSNELSQLDSQLGGVVTTLARTGVFEAKWQQLIHTLTGKEKPARQLLLLGAGNKRTNPIARARQLGITAVAETEKLKAKTIAVASVSTLIGDAHGWEQFLIGFRSGAYKYPKPNLDDKERAELETRLKLTAVVAAGTAPDLTKVRSLGDAMEFCRVLQDSPPNLCTPAWVADHAAEKARALGLDVQVWDRAQLERAGFHSMLSVASGSVNDPRFVVIDYKPKSYTKTLALVGKGLTMDTGGYSLKPPESQRGMKYDMSGAAITLSSVMAIAQLQLPIRVLGIGALCENMVDAKSYRVDDVIHSYAGKTIEVKNTDAEGRLVLADALAYTAAEYQPDAILEYSTLTGAMVVALGHFGAGVFSFPDDTLGRALDESAAAVGEPLWLLPTWEEVNEEIKGTISDLCNIGVTPRAAGSIVAAMFLKEFVGSTPFAHIDVAGVAADNMATGYPRKGSAGYGIQLAVEHARRMAGMG